MYPLFKTFVPLSIHIRIVNYEKKIKITFKKSKKKKGTTYLSAYQKFWPGNFVKKNNKTDKCKKII